MLLLLGACALDIFSVAEFLFSSNILIPILLSSIYSINILIDRSDLGGGFVTVQPRLVTQYSHDNENGES